MVLQWYDAWRLVLFLVAVACVLVLICLFVSDRHGWNDRKRDYWFILVMWSISSAEMQLEGLLRDTGLRVRLVFITIASVLTLRLLVQTKKPKVDEELH